MSKKVKTLLFYMMCVGAFVSGCLYVSFTVDRDLAKYSESLEASATTPYVGRVLPPPHVKPVCRHYALWAASLAIEEHPVRLVGGDVYDMNGKYVGKHIQAQAQVGDEWYWIDVGNGGYYFTKKDFGERFVVSHCFTLDEYVDKLVRDTEIERKLQAAKLFLVESLDSGTTVP